MDFSTARARVRETLSLTTDEDTRVGQFVNEAIIDFMRDAAPVATRFSLTTVVGQTDYDLSRDVAAMELTELRIVATGGTLTVTPNGGTTAAIAFDADAAAWVAALEASASVDVGEVDVTVGDGTGGVDDPIVVLVRWNERTNMVVTADGSSLTGPSAGVQVTTLREGGQQGVLRILGDVPYDANARVETNRYVVMGTTTLVLRDAPTKVETIEGWCVPRPVVLVVTTDDAVELPVPREFQRGIVYRALQIGAEWDRQDDSEVLKWEGRYEAEVAKCRRSRTRAVGAMQRPRLRPSSMLGSTRLWMDRR